MPFMLSMTSKWLFVTNHAHVLAVIAADPSVRLRDIASAVGITERAVHRIVSDLDEAGYVSRHREGRTNRYEVHEEMPMRHAFLGDCSVRELLDVLLKARPLSSMTARGSLAVSANG